MTVNEILKLYGETHTVNINGVGETVKGIEFLEDNVIEVSTKPKIRELYQYFMDEEGFESAIGFLYDQEIISIGLENLLYEMISLSNNTNTNSYESYLIYDTVVDMLEKIVDEEGE